MTFCEGDVKQMARQLRTAFLNRKRMLEPGYKTKTDRHERIWLKAAEMCLQNDIQDADSFIEAQFSCVNNPYPNMIVSPVAVSRYEQYRQDTTEDGQADTLVFIEMDTIAARVNRGFDMREVLLSPHEDMTPPVKYVAAVLLNLPDVAEKLAQSAIDYAKKRPDLAAALKRKFPEVKQWQQLLDRK